ncbi:MAG: hypothetical protein ACHQK9_06255 [Reyranellales bacterium]
MRRAGPGLWLALMLWAVFGTVVIGIGFVLLRACGLPLPLAPDFCPAAPPTLSAEAERGATLARLVGQLERELAERNLACASIPPPLPPPLELPTHAGRLVPQQTAQLKPPPEPTFEERLKREGAQSGELQVSLAWDGPSDLDLHVFCPNGEEIYFNSRSHCGGNLDVDMNSEKHSLTPVENVYWPAGQIPKGRFRVAVRLYGRGGDSRPNIPFLVRLKIGDATRVVPGTIASDLIQVTEFVR